MIENILKDLKTVDLILLHEKSYSSEGLWSVAEATDLQFPSFTPLSLMVERVSWYFCEIPEVALPLPSICLILSRSPEQGCRALVSLSGAIHENAVGGKFLTF